MKRKLCDSLGIMNMMTDALGNKVDDDYWEDYQLGETQMCQKQKRMKLK